MGRVGEGSRSRGMLAIDCGCSGMGAAPFSPGRTPFRKELVVLMVEAERPCECEIDPLMLCALDAELI